MFTKWLIYISIPQFIVFPLNDDNADVDYDNVDDDEDDDDEDNKGDDVGWQHWVGSGRQQSDGLA